MSRHKMKYMMLMSTYLFVFCIGISGSGNCQFNDSTKTDQPKRSGEPTLFETDDVLSINLRGNINALLKDRSDNAAYHPVSISYNNAENREEVVLANAKTRGHFRRLKENCAYPPLAIKFSNNGLQNQSIFKGQHKLKLVMPCQGDEYIIHEWLVYKIYNLVTPTSFKARLLRVTLLDENSKQIQKPFYAFLLEDEDQMALRNHLISVERKLQPQQTSAEAFLIMSVFEYLVANTDWSVQYLQNIKLLAVDSNAVPLAVPYDFDHAGIVRAPYAQPFEALRMRSITERRYRGYCITDMKAFEPVIDLFNRIKVDIYNLYSNCSLLDDRYKKRTLKYLDEFYSTINNPKDWQKAFSYPCDKNGTGNVVIKGLQD